MVLKETECLQGNDTKLVDSLAFLEEEDLPVIQKSIKVACVQFVAHSDEIREKKRLKRDYKQFILMSNPKLVEEKVEIDKHDELHFFLTNFSFCFKDLYIIKNK